MIIENKYGLSTDQVQRLVKDGIIPGSVKNHYDIYEKIQAQRLSCPSCSLYEVFRRVEESTNGDFSLIKKIFYTIGKNL